MLRFLNSLLVPGLLGRTISETEEKEGWEHAETDAAMEENH